VGKVIKGIDAIGPLSSGNVITKHSTEPTWGTVDSNVLPSPSEVQSLGPLGVGNIVGRNTSVLKIAFPASSIGLEGYDPEKLFIEHMKGEGDLWQNLSNGPAEYGLDSVDHMTFKETPNLKNVAIDQLNIPNAYVPDISAGQAVAADYMNAFNEKYSGKQNSYPQGSTEVFHAGTTVEGNDGGLNPIETKESSLGSWLSPTLGKWQSGT